VAIVDPPRAGLHHDVLKALRACTPLKRLVFVSCHAPAFVGNAVPLCRPTSRSFAGAPFVPTQAYAVDLFPHTAHCELIVLLEREGGGPEGGAPGSAEPEASTAASTEEFTEAGAVASVEDATANSEAQV
jgi:tRNA (uracil-5-)-methyltransferase